MKSPVKNIAKGFSAFIFESNLSKFSRNLANSGLVWSKEGLLYKMVKKIFLRPNFSSATIDSSKDRSERITTGSEFLKKIPTPPYQHLKGVSVYFRDFGSKLVI